MDSILRRLEDISKLMNGKLIKVSDFNYEIFIEESSKLLKLYQPLRTGLQFCEMKEKIVIQMTRVKGDYISFMDFFTIVYDYFK